MRLPNFLVIGAMKSGTTSLYHDLICQDDIFMPDDKEPSALCTDAILQPGELIRYQKLFSRGRGHQVVGEASTAYSMLPDVVGVPERASKLLGNDIKIIYVVRNPVSRVVSHYNHEFGMSRIAEDVNKAIHHHPRLVNYSRYKMQLQPWLAEFERDKILVIVFEEYVRSRKATVKKIMQFLGINKEPGNLEVDKVYNKGAKRYLPTKFWAYVATSVIYRRWVRPLMTSVVRRRFFSYMLPKAPSNKTSLSEENHREILLQTSKDVRFLRYEMNVDTSLWVDYQNEDSVTGDCLDR
jgi:hypothetical protein